LLLLRLSLSLLLGAMLLYFDDNTDSAVSYSTAVRPLPPSLGGGSGGNRAAS